MLKDAKVISNLNFLQEQYVMCPIDKAGNNIRFICKKYYVHILLKELGLLNTTSNTNQKVNDTLCSSTTKILLTLLLDLKIMRDQIIFHVLIGSQK